MRLHVQIFGQQPGLAATLTQLRMARLSKISDEGLTSLSSLSELRSLSLAHTAELTRKGLAPLQSLNQLTALKCAYRIRHKVPAVGSGHCDGNCTRRHGMQAIVLATQRLDAICLAIWAIVAAIRVRSAAEKLPLAVVCDLGLPSACFR